MIIDMWSLVGCTHEWVREGPLRPSDRKPGWKVGLKVCRKCKRRSNYLLDQYGQLAKLNLMVDQAEVVYEITANPSTR